ncbi:formin-like protein 6 [Iris pallida]|uniref:Formin-like protein 6 n=1 Tax=Iris pallida TaxID=29817 RepID=A0AAX6GPH0_IRIPA|nr:formin-like protein 6 [Iris pallida]
MPESKSRQALVAGNRRFRWEEARREEEPARRRQPLWYSPRVRS